MGLVLMTFEKSGWTLREKIFHDVKFFLSCKLFSNNIDKDIDKTSCVST